jgi:hypothetical protein
MPGTNPVVLAFNVEGSKHVRIAAIESGIPKPFAGYKKHLST